MTTPPADLQRRLDGLMEAIRAPYLYIGGDELPAPVREHLGAHLGSLEVVVLPGRGHLVHLAEPDRFAELVAHFSERVSSPARA
jgi:pimeloyl-ACP methyl ester carboxylesterase